MYGSNYIIYSFNLTLLSAKWSITTWKHVLVLCPRAKPQVSEIKKL